MDPDRDGHCGGHRRRNYPSWRRLDWVVDRSKARLDLAEVFEGAELVWLVGYLGDGAGSADAPDRQTLIFMDLSPKRSPRRICGLPGHHDVRHQLACGIVEFLESGARNSYRARRARRSGLRINTLGPSTLIQPRRAKLVIEMLTVSLDTPASWAISVCVRLCTTRNASPSGTPIRRANCSRHLATRPVASVNMWSETSSFVRLSRRASICKNCSAMRGW